MQYVLAVVNPQSSPRARYPNYTKGRSSVKGFSHTPDRHHHHSRPFLIEELPNVRLSVYYMIAYVAYTRGYFFKALEAPSCPRVSNQVEDHAWSTLPTCHRVHHCGHQ